MRLETVGRWGERCGYGTREPAAVAPATTASQHVPADHAPRPFGRALEFSHRVPPSNTLSMQKCGPQDRLGLI